jgi:sugar lactone lactonase YvrE
MATQPAKTASLADCYSWVMLSWKLLIGTICLLFLARSHPTVAFVGDEAQTAHLRSGIKSSPELPAERTEVAVNLPKGKEMGIVSGLAYDPKTGTTWILQRGDTAEPVIAVNKEGRVLHSFGKGLFKIPHSIRLGPKGNVWTVDAGNSRIIEFAPEGEELLHFDVDDQEQTANGGFSGATDIAFASGDRIFISDGYVNAHILEYTADGKKLHQWGRAGSGPGEFHLPHSVVVDDENDILYVADRENGRIEKFDLDGKYLGAIAGLGRVYSLQLGTKGTLWAAMSQLDQPPGSSGWIVELDRTTGRVLGHISVPDTPALHCLEMHGEGQPMTDIGSKVVWFKRRE